MPCAGLTDDFHEKERVHRSLSLYLSFAAFVNKSRVVFDKLVGALADVDVVRLPSAFHATC